MRVLLFLPSITFVLSTVHVYSDPVSSWVAVNGDASFTANSQTTNSPTTTDARADTIMGSFPEVTLSIGDSAEFSGSVTIHGPAGELPSNQLRWGLFHTPNPPVGGVGSNYVGLWSAVSQGATSLRRANGSTSNPFNSSAATNIISASSGAGAAEYNEALTFSIHVTRINDAQMRASASLTDGDQFLVQWPESVTSASPDNFSYNSAGFLMGGTLDNSATASISNANVEVTRSTIPVTPTFDLETRLFGVDFNSSEVPGSPTYSRVRVISGRETTPSPLTKQIGDVSITVATNDGSAFEFRGANGDSSRVIPGGDISRSFLVSDFIGSQTASVLVTIEGLETGTYTWASYHLDSIVGNSLGFASGTSNTSANRIEASIDGESQATIVPTSLGLPGLNTTSIADSDIPTLAFTFSHDSTQPTTIELSGTLSNGSNRHVFFNGFEIYQNADTP